jgi:two-component system alkaline phosphatase synthesis response regulator PhoP
MEAMKHKILVVEDEPSLSKIMKYDLENVGFNVFLAHDGEEAYRLAKAETFECLIVDWMIPKMDGLTFIKKIRSEGYKQLIVMLTARGTEFDTIEGFSSGADLYLKKPFSNRELIAQIKALFKRFEKEKPSSLSTYGDIKIDHLQFKIYIKNKEIELTKLEFELLKLLLENQTQVISRDDILSKVWGFKYDGVTRIVDVHVYNLKQKMKDSKSSIRSVRGVGYAITISD